MTVIVPRAGPTPGSSRSYARRRGAERRRRADRLDPDPRVGRHGDARLPDRRRRTSAPSTTAATAVLGSASRGIGVDDVIIPVVGECDSSGVVDVVRGPGARRRAGGRGAGRRPHRRRSAEGQVGAGIGMHCCDFAGGIGTASRHVAAATRWACCCWSTSATGRSSAIAGRLAERRARRTAASRARASPSWPPTRRCCRSGLERLARRAFLGLARAGSYASNGSGEIAIAFSTANADGARRDAPDRACGPRCCAPRRCTRGCSPPARRRRRRRSSTRCSARTRSSGRAARRTRSRSSRLASGVVVRGRAGRPQCGQIGAVTAWSSANPTTTSVGR